MVAGDGMSPAAYFYRPRKATFLNRRFYRIFTAPLTKLKIINKPIIENIILKDDFITEYMFSTISFYFKNNNTVILRLGISTTYRKHESFNDNLFMPSTWKNGMMEYWNDELKKMSILYLIPLKRNFTITQLSIFSLSLGLSETKVHNPIFQYSLRGVGPTGRRPIVSEAN